MCGVHFRHSGWSRSRALVRASLVRVRVSDRRIDRFDRCGSDAWVLEARDTPGLYAVASNHCRDRFCQPCAAERANRIARNLREALGQHPLRFVTLTLRTAGEPLAESLDRLYRSFGRLRRTKLWRTTVDGGAACLEIKWQVESQRWHPHLHLLVTGKYLPQKALSAAWLRASGDSYIVDVRLVRNADSVSSYVAKYATKPLNSSFIAIPNRLDEAVLALRGRRMVLTFGAWSRLNLLAITDATDWIVVAPLWRLITQAEEGDLNARLILARLRERTPCTPRAP